MTRLNRIFAVSFIAMLAVPTVHAKVVTQTNIVGTNGVSVTVPTSGTNAGKVQISGPTMPTIDSALSSSSTNAVQNKVVNSALAGKVPTTRTVNGKALSGNISLGASDVGAVPTSRTVNSKALSGNITLSGADVAVTGYAKAETAAEIAATDTVNAALGKLEKALEGKQASGSYVPTTRTVNGKALSADISLTSSDVGAVPTSRTVNGKALSGNISLGASDVGAVPTSRTVNGKALSSNISLGASDVGAVATAQGTTNKDKVLVTNAETGNVETTKFIHADGYSANATDKDTTIPSVELVENIALDAVGDAVALDQTTNNKNKAMITDANGTVVPGTIATGMITDSAVTSAKIANNTIVDADISTSAAIAQSKINGLTTALANAQNKIPSGSENSPTLASIWVE